MILYRLLLAFFILGNDQPVQVLQSTELLTKEQCESLGPKEAEAQRLAIVKKFPKYDGVVEVKFLCQRAGQGA